MKELETSTLPAYRQQKLTEIAAELSRQLALHRELQLVWVCNHNARRSQLAEAWSHVLFDRQAGMTIASAGETQSAVHPNAITALQNAGFNVQVTKDGYILQSGSRAFELSSKRLDQLPASSARFVISVCTTTDAQCPFVPGAVAQFSLPFDDPKVFDNQADAQAAYAATCADIARQVQMIAKLTNEQKKP
ncbi:MAG: hypothetical protein ACOCZ8_06090 [Bacteroidota bacterium]